LTFVPVSDTLTVMMKCSISFKNGPDRRVPVPSGTFKIERENAWAMIVGYDSGGKKYYQSIYVASERANVLKAGFNKKGSYTPKVISYRTTPEPMYPVSDTGLRMGVSDYTRPFPLRHRYVAILDRVFHITDKELHRKWALSDLWPPMCDTPGIFKIWKAEAPYNVLMGRFDMQRGGAGEAEDPQILVLRLFELDRQVLVRTNRSRCDSVVDRGEVRLKRPIVPYDSHDRFSQGFQGTDYFKDILTKIQATLSGFRHDEEIVNDTSQIEIRTA